MRWHKLLCADSHLLTWSLPWCYSPVGPSSLPAAASAPWMLDWTCLTNTSGSSRGQETNEVPQTAIFRVWWKHPGHVLLPCFWFLLCDLYNAACPAALPFRSRLYKWNGVIEEKVQIGSSCKWSLVSGRRFLFRLCSQTGVWSFKGENHTSVTSGLSDPLTFSPRAGVWVTHYKTELSSPSLSSLPKSQKHNFNS